MAHLPVRIGSQLFTNPDDTPAEARAWVRQMRESRLSLIRLFVFWDQIQPEKDRWDFSLYDAIFEEAEAVGIQIIPTLGAGSPPGWAKAALGVPDPHDLDDPAVWKLSLAYVRRVVERYHHSPALDSWILWNEPAYQTAASEFGERTYSAFLKKTYGEVDAINRVYRSAYRSFEEVAREQFAASATAPFSPYPQQLDQMRFAVDKLVGKLAEIGAQVKEIDPRHPLHVNPHNVSQCILPSGQSLWEEAQVVDFLGCSAHPSWHSTRFPLERLHQSVALFADLTRGATPHKDGLFWVTELQGGTNIFSGNTYLCPSADDLRHWMWASIGAGAKAVVFWCFNARKGGFEGGEWGLVNQQNHPSPRLRAVEEVAGILDEHADLFAGARPPRPDVWILHSEDTAALALIEGRGSAGVENPRNQQMTADALAGAYLMCADLGLNVQIIDEQHLLRSEFAPGSVLLLPGVTVLDTDACQALEAFVRKGGILIADGLVGYKERNGQISFENRMITDQLFGAALVDIEAARDFTIQVEAGGPALPGWFLKCSLAEGGGAQALGRFAGGELAVARHVFGQGAAVRIGTLFFQRYFSQPQAVHLDFFRRLLPELPREVVLENSSYHLQMKCLSAEGAGVIILINTAEACSARLRFAHAGKLECLHRPLAYSFTADHPLEIELPARGVLVFQSLEA